MFMYKIYRGNSGVNWSSKMLSGVAENFHLFRNTF